MANAEKRSEVAAYNALADSHAALAKQYEAGEKRIADLMVALEQAADDLDAAAGEVGGSLETLFRSQASEARAALHDEERGGGKVNEN